MKQTNEKKQDFLLDALSCIDEDILARGLALRDGEIMTAASAERDPKATETAYLFDLTPKPPNPPKKNPWRVLAVAAAACLLLCAVPLSMWMAGSMTKNDAEGPPTLDGIQNGILDGNMNGGNHNPDDTPPAPMESMPEAEAPGEPVPEEPNESIGTESPKEESTEEDREDIAEPETELPWAQFEWTVVTNQNGNALYTATGNAGVAVTLSATVITGGAPEEPVKPEDEAVLKLIGQWMASVYSLDYAIHFPLFSEATVQERFTAQVQQAGMTYSQALASLWSAQTSFIPFESLHLYLTLEHNRLFSDAELTAYRQETGRQITSARRFTVSGSVVFDDELGRAPWGDGKEFVCYEMDGRLYLDDAFMDDDLSVDLAQSAYGNGGFYEVRTTAFTANGKHNGYLYTEEGNVFHVKDKTVMLMTDNGEWHRVSDGSLPAHGTVEIEYYAFRIENLHLYRDGELLEGSPWSLHNAFVIYVK